MEQTISKGAQLDAIEGHTDDDEILIGIGGLRIRERKEVPCKVQLNHFQPRVTGRCQTQTYHKHYNLVAS